MFIGSQQANLDKEFLKRLDTYPIREVYAKIVSLDWDEKAITEITGHIVSGNISVDGSSSTRRTCSLTLVTDDKNADVNKVQWGLQTKFVALVGLKNFIDNVHDDIIWFQQGIFIITSFSTSTNSQGTTISIQGKDKMCLLDGSIGGSLFADHDFGKLEVINSDGTTTQELIEIHDLIENAVHTYGLEAYENILISDIDDVAVELLDYKVPNKNLFLFDISATNDFATYVTQMAFSDSPTAEKIKAAMIEQGYYDENSDTYLTYYTVRIDGLYYRIIKYVTYGDTVGYRRTSLTYAGDLIVNAGNPVTEALDKVVNMLGEFEYYYDVYGRFVFQRKRVYHNITWNGAVTNEGDTTYYDSVNSTQSQYEFINGFLIDSFSNKPNLANIRNDFAIWGSTSTEAPIHLRYAIDTKPTSYKCLYDGWTYKTGDATKQMVFRSVKIYAEHNTIAVTDIAINETKFWEAIETLFPEQYESNSSFTIDLNYYADNWGYEDGVKRYTQEFFGLTVPDSYINIGLRIKVNVKQKEDTSDETDKIKLVDWREILYRMAYDNSRAQGYIEHLTLATNHSPEYFPYNKDVSVDVIFKDNSRAYYDNTKKTWIAGSSVTYDKLEELQKKGTLIFGQDNDKTKMSEDKLILIDKWQNTWNTGYDYLYADMLAFWRLLYDNRSGSEIENDSSLTELEIEAKTTDYGSNAWAENGYWNPDLFIWDEGTGSVDKVLTFIDPTSLLFWLDFIGEDSELEKYSVSLIGRRPKVVNDSTVKAIFFRDIPEVLFVDPTDTQPQEATIQYAKLNLTGGLLNYFRLSGQGKSAKETLDNMLYDYTYYQESITLSSLPIYYLEPNTRISVSDKKSGIEGEYIVKSFSYSLAHDGMMSITATRAAERIV